MGNCNGLIRIGKVSRIEYETGRIAVTYSDKDESTTALIPFLSLNGEYKMPEVEQYVVVAHLSTGTEVGIALGTYWTDYNPPPVHRKGLYRKDFSNTPGEAYMQYDHSSRTLVIKADHVRLLTLDNEETS